jgi:phosphoribosylanthranilate isomerase
LNDRPRVKICCISSRAEADLAIRAGAAALGLVSHMPSGPGVIPDDLIRDIAARVPPGVSSFLLTSRRSTAEIIEQQRRLGPSTLQICDRLEDGGYRDLRRALPGISLVQVVHVRDEAAIDEALTVAADVDAILLDSGNPELRVKELGGTGRTHDWAISREIVERVPVPVFLAGGLRPDNVAAAIRQVRPFGVDICSGVRTAGRLDEVKLRSFFAAALAA